jgi:hypothetical protein
MELKLPDGSTVRLDKTTLRFKSITPTEIIPGVRKLSTLLKCPSGAEVNFNALAKFLESPIIKFSDSLRRLSAIPRYSAIQSKNSFDIRGITKVFAFPENYQGGTFCPSTTTWNFLDGGIVSHSGYGWGSHSWTVVQGYVALRAICMFNGIQQPRLIKGEPPKRPLSFILEDVTYYDPNNPIITNNAA